ncbi:glycine cleavage system H protein [Amphibacillus marinus]|uniref:Glycine cleavage system H protein n=1 Tax=Amphibacillus marinus TaxID=872970 RepID=A0A1H8ITA5_9BACI|nr:glycine cleavage system protein GcvH [Amphibacillus marinus]SEN72070.1 glycine cleavage system H protein [Amphibacillus marinus]
MTKTIKFTIKHEWIVPLTDNRARIGITDFAQQELGDIVYVENAEVDDKVNAGDSLGVIESVKAASDFYAPISGTIVKVNESLEDEPEKINSDPYEAGWLVEIEFTDPSELEQLLDEAAYQNLIAEGEE